MNINSDFKNPGKDVVGELFEKNDCFQGQRKAEHIETIIIRHKIVLIPAFFLTIFGLFSVLGINGIIRAFIPNDAELFTKISLTVDFIFVSIITHFLFISLLNYYLKYVIITNLRIIDVKFTTIFARNMDALDLHNIQDINMSRKGFWRWALNFGRIVMHNSSGNELFDFKFLKNPLKNYNIINHVHYKALHSRLAIQKEIEKHQIDINPKQTEWEDLSET